MNKSRFEDKIKYISEKIDHLRLRRKELKYEINEEIKRLKEQERKEKWDPIFREIDPLLNRYLHGEKLSKLAKEYKKCPSTLKSRMFKRKMYLFIEYRKTNSVDGLGFNDVAIKFFEKQA